MTFNADSMRAYAAQGVPLNDTDGAGGGIDATMRTGFTPVGASSVISVSATLDSPLHAACTVRTKSGKIITLDQPMPGVFDFTPYEAQWGPVAQILRLKSAPLPFPHGAIVNEALVLHPGEAGFTEMFINAYSVRKGGIMRYEKFFWKNVSIDNLNTPAVTRCQDVPLPEDGIIVFGIEGVKNGQGATANRLQSPGAGADDVAKKVPTGVLEPGDAIGVWLRLRMLPKEVELAPQTFEYSAEIVGLSFVQ